MKKILFLTLGFLCSWNTFSQVLGATTSQTENFDYQESMTNVQLDPNPTVGPASEVSFVRTFSNGLQPGIGWGEAVDLLGVGVNIPGWVSDLAGGWTPFCFDFDPYFNLSASIDVGGYYMVREVGNSNIDIDYPVAVTITYPEQNTFGCGYEIRIDTDYEILEPNNTNKLKVTPPFINQEIGPKIENVQFNAGVGIYARYGVGVDNPIPGLPDLCAWVGDPFDESIDFSVGGPSLPSLPSILNICESAYGPGANEASLLSCGDLSSATPLLNLGQFLLDTYNAQHGTNYTFAAFPNNNEVQIFTPDLPTGGPTLPEMGGSFKKVVNSDLGFQSLQGGKVLKVSGVKNEISEMSVDLVSFIDYSGYPTSLSLGGGLGSLDLGDVAPTFTVDQTMDFEFTPVINMNLDIGQEMEYTVYNSDDTESHSGFGQIVSLVAGQYILAQFPSDLSDPLTVTGSTYLDGDFKSLSTQKYFQSLNLKFAEANIPGVINDALIDETTPQQQFGSKTIIDHSFNLEPTYTFSMSNFLLDPENPIVNISSVSVEDVKNLGGGERAVVYKIGISNDGDVRLKNLRLRFDLDTWFNTADFYEVECITSDYFAVNTGYDGALEWNLLDSDNSLEVGDNQYVELLIRVKPEISEVMNDGCFGTVEYDVSAIVYGTSPIGTEIESNFYQCTGERTAEDIVETVDLGAAVLSSVNDFTVYAENSLVFSKAQPSSKGNAGSGGNIDFENVSMTTNETAIVVGDLHATGQIRVLGESDVEVDYVQVGDRIRLIGNASNFEVTGAISDHSSCVFAPELADLMPPNNTSNVQVVVGANQTQMLPPGSYKSISLNQNSKLILTSGTYNIKDWKFNKTDATVEYNLSGMPVIMNIQNMHANKERLSFIVNASSSARDVYYNIQGNGSTHFNESFVQGNIFAPEGSVEFSNNSTLEGTCFAETIKFKTGSSFAGHDFIEPLNIGVECQGAVQYRAQEIAQENSLQDEGKKKLANHALDGIEMLAFPNPMRNRVNLSIYFPRSVSGKLVLQDFKGTIIQVLDEGNFNSDTYEFGVDVGLLPQGLYFYSFITADGVIVEKLIKH